ncbi:MAG: hypothetical protein WA949_13335 [Phormidesmis sp.]
MPRGRKARPVLWRPDQSDTVGPFFSVLATHGKETPMGGAIDYLSNLETYSPTQNPDRRILYQLIRWITSDVARRKWGVNLKPALDGKPLRGQELKLVRAEGALWTKILNLAAAVHLADPHGYPHAAVWWALCILEAECTSIVHAESEDSAPVTKGRYLSGFEEKTAALKRRENPFNKPHTNRLFGAAIVIADGSTGKKEDEDLFYAREYVPYIEARSSLSAFLRKKGTQKIMLKTKLI